MSDLLATGASALLAYQRALQTTGHNVSNVNTQGYSRQRVDMAAQQANAQGGLVIGNGVRAAAVERLADQFLFAQSLGQGADMARLERFEALSSRLDQLLSNPDSGLSRSLNSFFDALGDVESNPSSSASRQTLIGSAEQLAARFDSVHRGIGGLYQEVDTRLQQAVREVNDLAAQIADLNEQIPALESRTGGGSPNDLLDQRDRLIQELAGKIGVNTAEQSDGSMNVFTTGGQALVVGRDATRLATQVNAFDATRMELAIELPTGTVSLSDQASSGEIGGLLGFRRDVLDTARASVGRVAVGLADAFNNQHANGVDQYGDRGADFFRQASPDLRASSRNTGSASLAASFSDPSALAVDSYLISFDGAAYSASRTSTGQAVSMSGAGTAANPFVLEGVAIQVSGAAAAGDSFLLRPTASGASSFESLIRDPARIAAANAVSTQASLNNLGGARISAAEVIDGSNPNLQSAASINFLSATSYSVNGGAAQAYSEGGAIDINGARVRISGTPEAGDQFSLAATPARSSDNGNANLLADLQDRGIFEGGAFTFAGAYSSTVSDVGTRTQQAGFQRDAVMALRDQVNAQRDSVSGVNLDEEAANLIRFQQAYQAASQVISIANQTFQTLLNAVS